MATYRYKHTCQFEHEFFIKADKDSIIVPCLRCGRNVTARQIRDKTTFTAQNNEVTGILRHEKSN